MNYYIFKKMKNKYIFSKIFILIALTWNYKLHDLYTIGETCNETIYVNGTFGIRNKRLLTDQKIGEGLKNPRLDENSWDKSGKKKLKNVSEPYSTMKELKLQKHRRNGAEKNYAKNKSPLKLLFKKSNLNCKEKVIAAYNYIRNFKQHIDWDKHRIRTKQFLRSIELFISVLSLVSFVALIPALSLIEGIYLGVPEFYYVMYISAYYGASLIFFGLFILAIIFLMD